jgi:predicted Zn-dependent protease
VNLPKQTKGLIWLVGAVLAAATAAAGVPFFAARIPWSWERRAAESLLPSFSPCTPQANAAPEEALHKLVTRLYPRYPGESGFPVAIRVIHGDAVNAYAGLGGNIFVYDGLLGKADSPEELAGVLAHEIEHVRRRHVIQSFAQRLLSAVGLGYVFSADRSSLAAFFLNLTFSRGQEEEADEGGLRRLRDAKIDPSGFERFFKRDETSSILPALLSDHPASANRAELARRFRGGPSEPVLTAPEWTALQSICR